MFNMGFQELLIIGIIAVLLFGKRLPEVARSLGQSYQQFRRGLHDIKSEVDDVTYSVKSTVSSSASWNKPQELDEPTAPVFALPDATREEESATASGATGPDEPAVPS
jgi:sec-independent protein translocase protein TatA